MATSSPRLVNLAQLDKQSLTEFVDSFDTVITDCDGVLWFPGKGPIAGSPQTITKLLELGKTVFLLTNNAMASIDRYHGVCQKLGMPVPKENIITTAVSTVSYLKEHNFSKKAFVVGSTAFVEHLEKSGIKCVKAPNHIGEDIESILQILRNLDPEVGAVILDVDPNMNFIKMSTACQYLKMKTDCLFIIGATEEVINIDETLVFGPRVFNELIVKNSERNAFTVGKPNIYLKDVINKIHPITPQRTLMIGDMLTQDVQLGTRCGFQTLFVLSGLDKLKDATNELYMPNYYIDSLGDLLPLL